MGVDFVLAIEPTVFGVVGAICTVAGTVLAIMSHQQTRKDAAEQASKQCHENLLAEQRITERLSKELRDLRVKYGEADEQ